MSIDTEKDLAIFDIKKGQELTYDYGYWYLKWNQPFTYQCNLAKHSKEISASIFLILVGIGVMFALKRPPPEPTEINFEHTEQKK